MRAAALVCILLALSIPTVGAQEEAATPCEIRAHLSIGAVRVVTGTVGMASIEDRDVRLTPIGRGLFHVHTDDDATRIEGTTEEPIAIALAAEQRFAGVATVAAGTAVDAIEPRGTAFRATLSVDDGVGLDRVTLQCRDLAVATPIDPAIDTSASAIHDPVWRARVPHLRLRSVASDEVAPLAISLEAEARLRVVWIERQRRAGWVRVQATLAHARLDGWARDTDLTHR